MATIKQILEKIECEKFIGDESQIIDKVIQISDECTNNSALFWCSEKNNALLSTIKNGSVICSANVETSVLNKNCNFILVKNPRKTFSDVLNLFFVNKTRPVGIEPSSFIHDTAKISRTSYIGHNVVIERNVVVGDDSIISHNTVIKENTVIGNKVKIGSNNTIGEVGFGYEKDEEGNYIVIPHIGNVVIEDEVEIGNNTCIDRAVLGSTVIRKNAKIDNLVHIAHGVEIGENSLIIANAMVAGSVKIGKNVWVAPSSSILNKKEVADNAVIGMGSVVLKNVQKGEVIIGNPGKPLVKQSNK